MAEQKSLPAMLSASAAAGGADWGVLQLGSHVAHWGLQGQAGYDHEGNALAYSYSVLNQQTHAWTATGYTVSYLKQDGYLEASTAGTSTNTSLLPTADTSLYDAFGRRIAIDSHAQGQTTDGVRAFAYDANGQILERRDGTATNGSTFTPTGTYATQHYAYVDGQQMGEVDEGGGIDVLSGVTGFSDSSQGTRSYVVQQGDTLDGIAQQVYGDASLWYVVADANGLASNSDLVMGQTLKLPQVTTDSNTAETFKPYDPNAIQGSTTPSLPHAPQPPPSAHHCNALAAIVVIAVAVVVSWATYGALAPEMDSWAGSVLAGAAAGAAGSAASQVAGDALGTQKGFDWGQVLVGAVGGAIGGGVAAKLSSEGSDFSVLADGSDNLEPLGNAIVGASSYVGSYEADKLVGEPAHFSWAGLVAETVGAAVAGKLGPTKEEQQAGITGETWGKTVAANAVQDVVQREVSVGLGDDHVQSWQQVGEDVFGNALGNAIGQPIARNIQQAEADKRMRQINATAQQMESNFSNELQGNIDAQMGQTGAQAMASIRAQGQATLDQEYAGTEQALDTQLAAMPDPSLAASIAAAGGGVPHGTVTVGPLQILSQGTGPDNVTGSDYGNWQVWASQAGVASPTLAEVNSGAYRRSAQAWYNAAIGAYDNQFPPDSLVTTFVLPNGPQLFTANSPEGAGDILRSQLGLAQDSKINTESIMNVVQPDGAFMEATHDGSELDVQALEDEARYEFGGNLAFSIDVKSQTLATFVMINGTDADNANMAMMNGISADAQGYAYDHTPGSRDLPEDEQSKVIVDGVGFVENVGTEMANVPASRLEYRYDVFVSPSDPSNFRVEVTQYNFDYAHGGGMLHYHPFLPQAYALLNGSGK